MTGDISSDYQIYICNDVIKEVKNIQLKRVLLNIVNSMTTNNSRCNEAIKKSLKMAQTTATIK